VPADVAESGYSGEETDRLQLIWGDGFLSPGGAREVVRILRGADLDGATVLDIGSGAGGADIELVRAHGAAAVVGVDVQRELVELAASRAADEGLGESIEYELVDPDAPLPFADATFDAVFTKDAIIHVADKEALYADAYRVLRPGGRLFVSDWLRGAARELDDEVRRFVEAAGHGFVMISLAETERIVESVGFSDVESEDRRAWYLGEATAELRRLRGGMRAVFVQRWSEDVAQAEIAFWEVLVASLRSGALAPGHIRATKPGPR
jgi:phosphoethanolamine N-methyltransferase